MAKRQKQKFVPVDLVTQQLLMDFNNAAAGKKVYPVLRDTLLDAHKRGVPIEEGAATLHVGKKKDKINTAWSEVVRIIKHKYPEIAPDVEQIVKDNTGATEQNWVQARLKAVPVSSILKPSKG